ncbi:serine hydroxymethyltransferase [Cupriavidus pinatubonensis]|uniref:serine hydroxymethyltransferase n=2 Tax=Cupriavidus pinatubonensis TaxID=248026 RepID=UPI001C739D71|nr:serine hydroxymethyltransferase [Cupriavidus pinatubonensis]QYY28146.1 serine hydroxymethyltransferase [Cupriavidus pinatubonensis]
MSNTQSFFSQPLAERDALVRGALSKELERQQSQVELIASENIVSRAVLEAQGSVLTNKYAEGYPGKRYYGGCEFADEVESLAIERVKQLFNAGFANVQPHSGAQANGSVMLALTKPGDTVLGMSLDAGGHLTHGAKPALSGKWFNAVQYGVNRESMLIDYDQVEALAKEHKPSLIIAGFSAYPRQLDFARFRAIADSVGAKLMVDMAHIAGVIAAGRHSNPVDYAHVVTSTTHKTLRGPRGGFVLTNHEEIAKKINSAVFPGLQGGPLMHVIAAKAVAFGEAMTSDFRTYIDNVLANAKTLGEVLKEGGVDLVTGGTDNHLLLVDLRPKGLKGTQVEQALERAGITCNKNGIPFDTEKPTITSGIRLGAPAATTRGFGVAEFREIGRLILEVFEALRANPEGDAVTEQRVRQQIFALCDRFPIYER